MRAYTTVNDRKVFGAYSTVCSASTMPNKPALYAGSYTEGYATLTWDTVPGAAGYQVWRIESDNPEEFKLIKSITDGSLCRYVNRNLQSKNTYTYKIRAYTEVDGKKTFGVYSENVNVTVK